MKISRVTIVAVVVALITLACGPANHSMKVEGVQSKVQDRGSCATQSDCDKLKADVKDLLEECKKMVSSGFWARTNCDTEEGMAKEVAKKEYANFLRSSLSEACVSNATACVRLMALSEEQDDDKAHRDACLLGCTKHKIGTACQCVEGYTAQAAPPTLGTDRASCVNGIWALSPCSACKSDPDRQGCPEVLQRCFQREQQCR